MDGQRHDERDADRHVHEQEHGEVALDRRELADFRVFHPGAEVADRHLVFGLAGDGARVATDAATLV